MTTLNFELIFLLFHFTQYVPIRIGTSKVFTGRFLSFKLLNVENDYSSNFYVPKCLFSLAIAVHVRFFLEIRRKYK